MWCDKCGADTITVNFTELYLPAYDASRTIYLCDRCQERMAEEVLIQVYGEDYQRKMIQSIVGGSI